MVLASVGLLLALVAVALLVVGARWLAATRHAGRELLRSVRREQAFRAEAAIADAWRDPAVAATRAIRLGHELVAGLSFGLLEQIPRTRRTTRAVRTAHDSIADSVYDAILGAIGAPEERSPAEDA